jgi:hypothetical protein
MWKVGVNSLLACLLRHHACISAVLLPTHSFPVVLVNTPDSVSLQGSQGPPLGAFLRTHSLTALLDAPKRSSNTRLLVHEA